MPQKKTIIDVYQILGLTPDVCLLEDCDKIIKKSYIKKAKKFHPDKHVGNEDVATLFELLSTAYNIIKDNESRQLYNKKLETSRQSENDFNSLKNDSTAYNMQHDKSSALNTKSLYAEKMQHLDNKHGFDRTKLERPGEKFTEQQMSSIVNSRAIQDVQYKPEKLFNEHLDSEKFNAAFDKVNVAKNGSIMEYNGNPIAWNDVLANYSNIDNLDAVYNEADPASLVGSDLYSNIDFKQQKQLTSNDIDNLENASYTKNYNKLDENYYPILKKQIIDRQLDTKKFNNMKMSDYENDTSGYGISDKLGLTKFADSEININNALQLLYSKNISNN